MRNLRLFACGIAALGALTFAGCSSDSSSNGTLRVQNNSDFSIVELHVAPVGTTTWGPNLLGSGAILAPGDSLTVDVNCDTYDALLVDETGVDCQLNSVDLCFNDAAWVINNDTCTVFGAAAKARAAAGSAGSAGSATPQAQ